MDKKNIVYDWNHLPTNSRPNSIGRKANVEVNDETLRDGLQATYVKHPRLEEKIILLDSMERVGINSANIGFPISGSEQFNDVVALAAHVKKNKYKISLECGGRLHKKDVQAIIEASQRAGLGLDAGLFIASSHIRHMVEAWSLPMMKKMIKEGVGLAVKNGLRVMFVTEDTTRAHPKTLDYLYNSAIDAGAVRLCLSDTVGHATPIGTSNLLTFIKRNIIKKNKHILLDWHGHNDRGLALANTYAAITHGINRVQATALGVGERAGNISMEELVFNLSMDNIGQWNLKELKKYAKIASRILKFKLPANYPIIGKDVFKTATGVHAAAILKSIQINNHTLAGVVYSAIDPIKVDRNFHILIGPMSGKANVIYHLTKHNIPFNARLVDAILKLAKSERRIVKNREILRLAKKFS